MIPLRPRLNSDRIEAGLITNRCQIWSISPLERRTYADRIHFNQRDLEPKLQVNRVISVKQSFFLQQFVFRLDLSS